MLILDKTMRPPQAVQAIAEPWIAAGGKVDYRQFYPYLVLEDTSRYNTIVLLCGRTPLISTAEITRDELNLLHAFHRDGKGLVFGYVPGGGGDGANDRAAINAFLQRINARVQIAETFVYDSENQYLTATGNRIFTRRRGSWKFSHLERIPLGHALPLSIRRDAKVEIFAESFPGAFIQKERLRLKGAFPLGLFVKGKGPVLLLPRTALAATGIDIHGDTLPLLKPALADTARIFQRSIVKRFQQLLAGKPLDLSAIEASPALPTQHRAVFSHLPVLARPPKTDFLPVETTTFSAATSSNKKKQAGENADESASLYSPRLQALAEKGIKGFWIDLPDSAQTNERALSRTAHQNLSAFFKEAGFNMLFGGVDALKLDTANQKENAVSSAAEFFSMIESVSAVWVGGARFRSAEFKTEMLWGSDGLNVKTWHPLNRRLWLDGFFRPIARAAHIVKSQKIAMTGFYIDMQELEKSVRFSDFTGFDFGDRAFRLFLTRAGEYTDPEILTEAKNIAPARRFTWLTQNGFLPLYYKTLSDEAERFGIELRRHARREMPDALWTVFMPSMPRDWFTLGFLRGLSRPSQPVILLTLEPKARQTLAWLRQQDVYVLHLLMISPFKYNPSDYPEMMRLAKDEHHGFWISGSTGMANSGTVKCGDKMLSLAEYARLLKESWENR